MVVKIKTKEEIKTLRAGGKILAGVINKIAKKVVPGANTKELNDLAEKLIKKVGAKPSFKGYQAPWSPKPFPTALCISINDEVVHGLPAERIIKENDVVGIDCGLEYKKLFTDMAVTVIAGRGSGQTRKLVKTTQEALMAGIKKIKPGVKLSAVAKAIQKTAEAVGFSVVRQLAGHGVGYSVHEPPQILNYYDEREKYEELQVGMVLAIEPMINIGGFEVQGKKDGWTVATADGSISAHFEHTIVVTDKGAEVLTK